MLLKTETYRTRALALAFVLSLIMLSLTGSAAHAKVRFAFGVDAQAAWTSEAFLQNPNGWGLFAAAELQRNAAWRFSFSDLTHSRRYRGTLQFGLEPYDSSLQNLLLQSQASMRYYEFTFHYTVLRGGKMQLAIGAGAGLAAMRLDIDDRSSTNHRAFERDGPVGTVILDLTVSRPFSAPVDVRLGYQYRTDPSESVTSTDNPNPIGELPLSAVRIGLVGRL